MTKKINLISKIAILSLLIATSLSLYNCQNDDESLNNQKTTIGSHRINHVPVKELFINKDFKNAISKITHKNVTSETSRTIMEEQYGFTIEEFKPASVIETDSVISYTLLINQPNEDVFTVENLIINKLKFSDSITAFKIKYESEILIEKFENFGGKSTITPIVYNHEQSTNITSKEDYPCIVVAFRFCENHACPDCSSTCIAPTSYGLFCTSPSNSGGGAPYENSNTTTTSSHPTTGSGGGTTIVTTPIYQMSPLELKRKQFTLELSSEQQQVLFDDANNEAELAIFNYLEYSSVENDELEYMTSKKDFVKDLLNIAYLENDKTDNNRLLNLSLIIQQGNYENNSMDLNFLNKIDPYVDLDLSNEEIHNPIIIQLIIKYNVLKAVNPTWSKSKLYWETVKDFLHLGLDTLGLVPVIGEVADLANGVIYTLEGDHLNATLSYASTIPIAGWVSASTKFGLKVVNSTQTAYAISTKVKLVWKISGNVITFGQKSQLRKVLGMAASSIDSRQAHHLIPWATQGHEVIQRAAKSGSAFHMNEALNGIAVAAWRNQPNHNAYNNRVLVRLNSILASNPNPQQAYDQLEILINNIRQAVINNPNTHLNDIIF